MHVPVVIVRTELARKGKFEQEKTRSNQKRKMVQRTREYRCGEDVGICEVRCQSVERSGTATEKRVELGDRGARGVSKMQYHGGCLECRGFQHASCI